ncbi:lim and transglutaminase domain protein ltd-1-like [Ruditapes philippinarum]|uniref:lim and transglutaminase domain protein ltd-1-like n=1 Tax=Ruditapes philippinarum TaxID=129788 RepID=UPI00295C0E7C|nr:lim and transglutaminase domain protein ltd-1-like [Ruditapes philippinarum]
MSRLHSYSEQDVNFYYIDENAKKAENIDNFQKLITKLHTPKQDRGHGELYLVRGMLVYIAHNQSFDNSRARYNTPLFYVQQLVERRISAAEVFKIYCGYAGIECELVTGRAKAIRYRAGDGDSDYLKNNTWLAFKADDKWHLVHPQWAIQAFVGYEHSGEIEIEKDGRERLKVRTGRQGTAKYMVNDFWFCTAPDIFVTRCFPDEIKWQDPQNNGKVLIKNVNDFLSLPDLRQGFYDMKLELLNEEKSCILHSKKGKCFVSIMCEKDGAKNLDFSYELAMEGTSSNGLEVKDTKQLVLYQIGGGKNRNIIQFEIRLPVVGTFWFRLAVGLMQEPDLKRNCCEFKIICKDACENCKRFPTYEGISAYGCGYEAEEAGLLHSSLTDAKINMPPNKGNTKRTIAKFKVDDDPSRNMTYGARMLMSGSDEVDDDQISIFLEGTTEVVRDQQTGTLTVNASVPNDGEYTVFITAKDEKDKKAKKAKPVAAYLVTTEVDEDEKRNNAIIKQREKEVRCKLHKQSKTETRNRLLEILQTTQSEVEELKVSGRKK